MNKNIIDGYIAQSTKPAAQSAGALAQCAETVQLRIRYNNALIEFYKNSSDLEFLQGQSKIVGFEFSATEQQIVVLREQALFACNNDLKALEELYFFLNKVKESPNDYQHRLYLATFLKIKLEFEKHANADNLRNSDLQRKIAERTLKQHRKNNDGAMEAESQKSIKVMAKKAKANYQSFKSGVSSELPTYNKIQTLLQEHVFTNFENEFIDNYTDLTFETMNNQTLHLFKLSNKFFALEQRNLRLRDQLMDRLKTRHAEAGLSTAVFDDIATPQTVECKKHDPIEFQNVSAAKIFEIYAPAYFARQLIQDYDAKDAELVAYEKQWQAEQNRIAAEEQAANAAREQEIAAQQTAAKLELQKIHAQKLLEQKRAEQQRREQHKLDKIKRVQEKEASRVQKAIERHKKHLEEFNAANKVVGSPDGKYIQQSKYQATWEMVDKNCELLMLLFDVNTRSFKYRDVESLINNFGGKLKKDTASSHQYIIFDDHEYQEIQLEQESSSDQRPTSPLTVRSPSPQSPQSPQIGSISPRPKSRAGTSGSSSPMTDMPSPKPAVAVLPKATSVVKPIARPHEPSLTQHNLRLLRDAIASILPEGWLPYLQAKAKTQSKLRAPRV